MMTRTWWIPVATCLALCGLQTDAGAYCLNIPTGQTKPVEWTSVPVTYHISSTVTDAKIEAAIDAAFTTWGTVPCSTLSFKKGAKFTMCTDKTSTTCKTGTVHFEHATPYIYVFWFTSATGWPTDVKYASYLFTWFGMTQNLTGASIAVNAFNTTYAWSTTGESAKLDVQNELTALVGATVGLTDSKVAGATMYPGMKFGDTSKRTLAQDDIDGLVYLYKKSGCADPPPPGANGCSGGSTTTDGGSTTKDGSTTTDGGTTTKDGSAGKEGGTTPDSGVTPDSGSFYDTGTGKQCTSSSQCAGDEVCTAEGICKKVGGEEDGCGCFVAGPDRAVFAAPAVLVLIVIGLLLLRPRRRRE